MWSYSSLIVKLGMIVDALYSGEIRLLNRYLDWIDGWNYSGPIRFRLCVQSTVSVLWGEWRLGSVPRWNETWVSILIFKAKVEMFKSHKFRQCGHSGDSTAATYWKSSGHGPPAPLFENCKYHLEAVAGNFENLISFIAGKLQTVVCLELVAIGLLYFICRLFYCPHSIPGRYVKLGYEAIKHKEMWFMSGLSIRSSDRVLIVHDHQLVFGLSRNYYQVCKTVKDSVFPDPSKLIYKIR